jgi:hypothetical protein
MIPTTFAAGTPGPREQADPDDVVDQFEEAWQSGRRPDLDAYLPSGDGRRPLLVRLIHVDLERRLKAGEAARVEDYLARYPELGEAEVVLELLAAEHEQRRRREPGLGAEEYARRFPQYRERLGRCLEAEGTTCPADDAGDRPPVPARPAIAGYEVHEELGRGGMGVVYKARHLRLDRPVALKMILAGGHAAEADLARFRAEAEAVARLQHPNIVQVYEVGEAGGNPYFSLEYVAGGNLAQRLSKAPLPARDAAVVLEALARAMHAAHQAGIVHRDLKPANVLLAACGSASGEDAKPQAAWLPKITDFGLAKRLDLPGLTQTGAILGTPSYMAPEQAEGRTRDVGPAVDVYALGAMLYECLTGRPPFKAATAPETVRQVIADEPPPPSRLNREVPRDLETVCLHCLHKDPRKRYASAAELADDLARFRAGEPVAARPTSGAERAARWVRRRPALAALAAVSAVAAVGLLVTVLWYNARLQAEYVRVARERDAAEGARKDAQAARLATEQALRESERRLALNYFAYGRLCAAAARLATAADRAQAGESLREFRALEHGLTLLGDEAVKPALADYDAALREWSGSGPPPKALRRRALAVAQACRKPWTDLIDHECPDLANRVRGLLYDRAVRAAGELAGARRREDVPTALKEFWELYWGELVMVADGAVEQAMIRLGEALDGWHEGRAPAEVGRRAADLREACRLPAPVGRGLRTGG